ncbi:aminoglycoside phosphotransferase [Xenophilus aerolatus]|nr:aminoglycoside phosphotransferase [Xenophilus aerolatus]
MDTTLVEALREALRQEHGEPVEQVETHISWVLLTSTDAFKLKKPVRLPFVDFSSVAARKHFCDEELRLNRRVAPALYLDVLPVCGSPASPRIGGAGAPIDHLVHMRRFPPSSLLSDLLGTGRLDPARIDGLAQRLHALHAGAERAAPDSGFGSPERIAGAVAKVLAGLPTHHDERLATLGAWMRDQERALRMAWITRQQSAAVRECHGDLHAGNVVLLDGELVPFDCIEFDPALRWIDVISDVAFLTMDLQARGYEDLAFRFRDVWLQHSGDYEGLRVWRFYEVYRALIRAMAAQLAPKSAQGRATPDYVACAWQLSRQHRVGARLMITHGFSGAGKSSVASRLLGALGAVRVRSDAERKRLHGLGPLARSAEHGLDIYGEQVTARTFERLRVCAREALLAGYPVIVDASFLRRAERLQFRALASELRVPFTILDCRADPQTLRRRVVARAAAGLDPSEAGPTVLEHQLAHHEALLADERACAIEVDTQGPVDIPSIEAAWCAAGRCA